MAHDYLQHLCIIMHGTEHQTLGSSILHLNYSEVFSYLYSWCITMYQTIHFYLFIIDNVLLALCSDIRIIHDRWRIYLSVNKSVICMWMWFICTVCNMYMQEGNTTWNISNTYCYCTYNIHPMLRSDSGCCYLTPW